VFRSVNLMQILAANVSYNSGEVGIADRCILVDVISIDSAVVMATLITTYAVCA
jgi:hypothetical protein